LEKLHKENSFVSKINDTHYRYHPLFFSFIRGYQDAQKMRNLYKIATEFYFEIGEAGAARRYAIKSEDSDLILKHSHPLFRQPIYDLHYYVKYHNVAHPDFAPEHICKKYPFFYMLHAWVNYLCGDASGTEYFFDKLYENIPLIEKTYPQFLDEIAAFKLLDCRIPCSYILESASNPSVFKNQYTLATLQLPFLHRRNRDCFELMSKATMSHSDDTDIFSAGLYCGFLYESNRLEEALSMALQLPTAIDGSANEEFMFSAYMHLASVYFAMGNDKQHNEIIQKTEQYIEKGALHNIRPNFLAYKTKTLLLDGNNAAAQKWLNYPFVAEPENNLMLYKVFQYLTTVRAHISLLQTNKAGEYIDKLKKLTADFNRPLDAAEVCILQAVLEWTTGKKKEAQATLESVLAVMQHHGFIRIVADEGAAILPVIKKIVSKVEKTDYRGGLNVHYVKVVYLATYTTAKYRKGYMQDTSTIKLSDQQKNMLSLLAQGYRNAEIVAKTGLSINTIRSHTRIAYEKLNVNTMEDAIIKARELKIIE